MGEEREIRVVLFNCELVCSLCKVSSLIHKVMWKLCVLSEGNIWESTKRLIVQKFRKPLPPCQLSVRGTVFMVESVSWWWTGFKEVLALL